MDGLCALDVVLAPQSTVPEDHATGTFIGTDIALLLAKCVVMTPSKLGGIATGRGNLSPFLPIYCLLISIPSFR